MVHHPKLTIGCVRAYIAVMELRFTMLCAFALGATSLQPAVACDWHAGGSFGYGYDSYSQDWLTYYEDEQNNEEAQSDRQYSTMSDLIDETPQDVENTNVSESRPQPGMRPSFSNSAIRASSAAKARLATNEAIDSAAVRISAASR